MTTPDPEATARQDSDDVPYMPRQRSADVQFAPGTMIAGRYRIASILGTGGMGEVYRADDIRLDQPVALKFLPARLARDPMLLGRLHDEVRLGRQIAHPNVCRIYDIADADGAHFVAMESIDGEDLSRLLRRIGRLAHDKAVDIARGIAAGLMAAHAKGILHRDLKPANIMIDSHGDAKIMDFGLALTAGEDDGTISGTPAYMAPEQLAGTQATVQSDLYALGLVMYELFTGKRAHNARTMPERMRSLSSDITTPSSVIRDIDPAVERIILRCLSNDPDQRPRSAREVIGALPGGDPLAAALAAGETPSPRVVAAAGAEGSLKPWQAWSMLAFVLLLTALAVWTRYRFGMGSHAGFDKSTEILVERAASSLRSIGIAAQPYTNYEFARNESYIGWINDTITTPGKWQRARRGVPIITFVLTESAQPPRPGQRDLNTYGAARVEIDGKGRLVSLTARPLRDAKAASGDWSPLLRAAGLQAQALTPAPPRLLPLSATDAHAAWSTRHPDDGTPIHVEAAAWRGQPVFFRITGAWENSSMSNIAFARPAMAVFAVTMMTLIVAIGLLLAWRNVRARRGDRGGALRVSAVMFVTTFAAELLVTDHQPSGVHEADVLQLALGASLLWAGVVCVLYLALEPFVRRRWPTTLIASSRMMAGNVRDPMVGRDVLIGLVAGLCHTGLIMMATWVEGAKDGVPPDTIPLDAMRGVRFALGHVLGAIPSGMLQGFVMLVTLVAFMLVFRRRVLAAAGLASVMLLGYYVAIGGFAAVPVLLTFIIVFVTARYGLVAAASAQAAFFCTHHYPFFVATGWQPTYLIPLAAVVAVSLWAFRTSLGSHSPFALAGFDE
jgi:hypothetical protein